MSSNQRMRFENGSKILEIVKERSNMCLFSQLYYQQCDAYLSDMTAYWTYQGSLTTPPLSENVTWIISQNVMDISEKQVSEIKGARIGQR